MIDEFNNKAAPEFNPQKENKLFKENAHIVENKTASEQVFAKESLDTVGQSKSRAKSLNKKKQEHALSILSASLVGVVGIVVVGMTNLVNVKMKAEFNEVEYRDGVIAYSIDVKDMSEKETLAIYPMCDGKKLEKIDLVDSDNDGVINGEVKIDRNYISEKLASEENVKIKYTLELKGVVGLSVERKFDRYVVSIDKMTSKFESVIGHCNCSVDGYYYFQMNFEDDNALFADFVAYIEDDFGNKSNCEFSDNLHNEQRIFVENLKGSHGKLVIKYNADGVETFVKGESGSDWIDINM